MHGKTGRWFDLPHHREKQFFLPIGFEIWFSAITHSGDEHRPPGCFIASNVGHRLSPILSSLCRPGCERSEFPDKFFYQHKFSFTEFQNQFSHRLPGFKGAMGISVFCDRIRLQGRSSNLPFCDPIHEIPHGFFQQIHPVEKV